MESKIYIGLITGFGEEKNIEELTSVAKYFDGLAAVYHNDKGEDRGLDILRERKGEGFVETLPYYGHNAHSMNHFLFNPKIRIGDWLILRDSAERISEDFAKNIRDFKAAMEVQGISTIYNYSKLLMFVRYPHQLFAATPHWGFHGAQPKAIQIDKMGWFNSEQEYCYSVRGQRPPFHFVDGYLRYYLMTDSNHGLLKLEDKGDVNKLFQEREAKRVKFLVYLLEHNIPATVDGFKTWLIDNADKLDATMKECINGEKILNDFYRLHVLKKTDFQDDHDWNNMIVV